MTAARRATLLLLALAAFALLAALPAAADAVTAQPELAPLSPAFVEALHDPMVTLGLGRMPSPVEVHVDAAAEGRAAGQAASQSFDLRAEGRLTPVKDQDPYATCWAFANVAALESRLMSATPPPDPVPDYSEDNMVARSGFGPKAVRRAVLDWRYNAGGYDFMAIAYFARWAGPLLDSDDPYTGSYLNLHATGPVQKHVQGAIMIPGRTSALDNDLVKQLVVENGALSVGMWIDWDLFAWFDPSTNAYYYPYRAGENHGVDIVGWDDTYPASDFGADPDHIPPADGAFLVRNSWGTGFGDGGYFWVSYYDRSFAREQGLGGFGGMTSYSVVDDRHNYSRIYQRDKLGVTAHTGYKSTRVWGANRFTARSARRIAAASFYTLASSTRYQVYAGRSFRRLTLRASGTTALPGYVTVPFTKAMRVVKGKGFVVAVKLVSPGEPYPLAIEYPRRSWMSGATARRGQSYISWNGKRWKDLTTVYRRSNVCLKAFAE